MDGATPSAEFLTGLCRALGISGEWLLTGRGPMRSEEVAAHTLRRAAAPDLLAALANAVESLIERVDRLDVFVSTMETRLRGRAAGDPVPHETASVTDRARLVARALPQRASADDHPDAPSRGA